jgi:hypothetical protein
MQSAAATWGRSETRKRKQKQKQKQKHTTIHPWHLAINGTNVGAPLKDYSMLLPDFVRYMKIRSM